jgi:hypothetical protein
MALAGHVKLLAGASGKVEAGCHLPDLGAPVAARAGTARVGNVRPLRRSTLVATNA